MPAVFDEASLQRQWAEEELERQRQIQYNAVRAIQREANYVEEHDYANMERQAGRKLSAEDFERRVKKLNPNLMFDMRDLTEHECGFLCCPKGSRLKALRWVRGDERQLLDRYVDAPMLNEFDTIIMRPKIITKVSVERDGPDNMITDLPKYRVEKNWDGTPKVVFDGINNIQEIIHEPCGVVKGWRARLAVAIIAGALTLDEVEREFDSADKDTWAAKTGKQKLIVEV